MRCCAGELGVVVARISCEYEERIILFVWQRKLVLLEHSAAVLVCSNCAVDGGGVRI